MPSHRPALTAIALLGLLAASPARAADVRSAEQAGMGGTAMADPRDNTAITSNPGLVGLTSRYDVQGLFSAAAEKSYGWGGSIVDGRTSKFIAFGLAYTGGALTTTFHPSELPGWTPADGSTLLKKIQLHDISLALAVPVLDRRLSFGLNGTVSILKGEWIDSRVTGNMDVGVAARPVPWISMGLVGKNVLPVAGQADTPAKVALGVRGGKEDLVEGAVDVTYQTEQALVSPWRVAVGVEGSVKVIRLRGGYDWDPDRNGTHRLAWGLGGFSKWGSIDYAMQIPLNKTDFKGGDLTHTLSLTVLTNFGLRDDEEEPIEWRDNELRFPAREVR